jgi:competence ComEA-like helix-hairpin-helix protein
MRKSLHFLLIPVLITILGATSLMADAASPAAATPGVVNINTADVTQLSLLPRVGAKVAQRIIDYRKEHGPFKSTTDLMEVKGIGDKAYTRLTPYLTVDGKTTLTEKIQGPHKPRSSRPAKHPASAAK